MPRPNAPGSASALATILLAQGCGDPGGRGESGESGSGLSSASASASVSTSASTSGGSSDTGVATDDDAAGTGTSAGTGGVASSTGGDEPPLECALTPDDPACSCDATRGGDYLLGPCAPPCQAQRWRYALWVTSYNVAGTLGYGEHQGLALFATRYTYDPRFGPADGEAAPWRVGESLWAIGDPVSEAAQLLARTLAPGGEGYGPAVELPGDSDDLFAGESLPEVPTLLPHPVVDQAALCEAPARVIDRRFFNHGRTLAEQIPNHAWDSFFWRRGLIPIRELAAFEVALSGDGEAEGVADHPAIAACLDVLADGFCEARCGNCSYVLSTGFGLPLGGVPDNQIEGIPQGSAGPYQIGVDDLLVDARDNFSRVEDGRLVWYVGGSSWGRTAELAGYDPKSWPDPDPVVADPGAFMSVVGPIPKGGTLPEGYDDAFTHCVDAEAWVASQSPILSTSMLSGRWGHNSNSDAEAILTHFLECATDPVAALAPEAWNQGACLACGEPRLVDGAPAQAPCQDLTHTAWSYWEAAAGIHNVDDLDLGRYSAVGPERVQVDHLSAVPDPICAWSGAPVFGM